MDYRFAIRCWQDQAGSENAKADVFVGSTKVADQVEITATSASSPQLIAWESTGLTAPASDTSIAIKVVLVNDYYVDADTDRNIHIDGIGLITKAEDGSYKQNAFNSANPPVKTGETTITDFATWTNYSNNGTTPTAVTGDQIPDNWWSSRGNTDFEIITVYGEASGVTMTVPLIEHTCAPS